MGLYDLSLWVCDGSVSALVMEFRESDTMSVFESSCGETYSFLRNISVCVIFCPSSQLPKSTETY